MTPAIAETVLTISFMDDGDGREKLKANVFEGGREDTVMVAERTHMRRTTSKGA